MDVTRNLARRFFWTALRFKPAYIAVELACSIQQRLAFMHSTACPKPLTARAVIDVAGRVISKIAPLSDAFEPEDIPLLEACCAQLEGKTERQKNPHPNGSLARAAWVCARLGGWTGYYGNPGPIVMLQGWLEFQAMKRGTNLMMHHWKDRSDV